MLPLAYTMDIETLALPDFRDRIGRNSKDCGSWVTCGSNSRSVISKIFLLRKNAAISWARWRGVRPDFVHRSFTPVRLLGWTLAELEGQSEWVFGIDADCNEQDEKESRLPSRILERL